MRVKMSTTSFSEKYGPWAVIAGGSEGIGKSFAEQLAGLGINLILMSRRADLLQKVKEDLESRYGVEVVGVTLDLTAPDLREKIDEISEQYDIGLLIYNAGAVHGAAPFLDESAEKLLNLINLNCTGPLLMAHKFGQQMRRRGRGGMILMSSMSALAGGAYIATYAATKAFDMILAEGLWDEFRCYGIDVLGLVAGATATPAMMNSGVTFDESPAAAGAGQAIVPMHSNDVASEGLENLGKVPIHVAGARNIVAAQTMREADRATAIVGMGMATAKLYSKSYPIKSA
jgi:short-subunit dehydrogenase